MDVDSLSALVGAAIFAAGYGLRAFNAHIDRRLTDQALKATRADEQQRLRDWLHEEADNVAKMTGRAPEGMAATYRMLADRISPPTDRR